MKALVIGGTNGFGRAVVESLLARGYTVITVGRTGGDYVCDVGEREHWNTVFAQIVADHPVLDVVVCVVGYARYILPDDLSGAELHYSEERNYLYAFRAYRVLRELETSPPGALFITIGSRWSYSTGEPCLAAYIHAKHKLRRWVENKHRAEAHPACRHYCVPTMATPQYELVAESAAALGKIVTTVPLADPVVVAEALVAHLPVSDAPVYVIDATCQVHEFVPD